MDDIIYWEVLSILGCLFLSAFFSGSETALTSLSPSKANHLMEDGQRPWLKLWLDHPIKVLTTILIGNNIVNVASAAIATDLANRLLAGTAEENFAIPLAVGVMTFLLLTFGEITPKALSKRYHESVSSRSIRILRYPYWFFLPITKLFVRFTKFLVRIFGGDPDMPSPFVTYEEIEYLIEVGAREGNFSEDREQLLMSIVEFPDTIVKEVMVPRTEMVGLPFESDLDQVIAALIECGHSRLPVYEESLDSIVGVFYAKDVLELFALKTQNEDFTLSDSVRSAYFVPESKKIADLLTEFRRDRIHMAIVVDEFGGTAGLVTLEDIVEEIFGEIQDEYDSEVIEMICELNDGTVRADGRSEIVAIESYFRVHFPEDRDYETLAGFLLNEIGRVPENGEQCIWNNLEFTVAEADEKKIISVEITRLEEEPLLDEYAS